MADAPELFDGLHLRVVPHGRRYVVRHKQRAIVYGEAVGGWTHRASVNAAAAIWDREEQERLQAAATDAPQR